MDNVNVLHLEDVKIESKKHHREISNATSATTIELSNIKHNRTVSILDSVYIPIPPEIIPAQNANLINDTPVKTKWYTKYLKYLKWDVRQYFTGISIFALCITLIVIAVYFYNSINNVIIILNKLNITAINSAFTQFPALVTSMNNISNILNTLNITAINSAFEQFPTLVNILNTVDIGAINTAFEQFPALINILNNIALLISHLKL